MGGDVDGIDRLVGGELTAWHGIACAGLFLAVESLVGICGLWASGSALGNLLYVYLLCLVVTLLGFVGVLFGAAFLSNNACAAALAACSREPAASACGECLNSSATTLLVAAAVKSTSTTTGSR